MDHEEAARIRAAESYLLGELSAKEREEFEEHFFGCHECAEEVRLGAVFAANARAVFAERSRLRAGWKAFPTRWSGRGLLIAALFVFVFLSGYLLVFTIPELRRELARLREPQPYPAVFLRPVTRGDDQVIEIPKTTAFLGLSVDIPPQQHYASYECQVAPESGANHLTMTVPAPSRPGSALNLLIPGSKLSPGRYSLILRGLGHRSPAVELNRYNFVVQFK